MKFALSGPTEHQENVIRYRVLQSATRCYVVLRSTIQPADEYCGSGWAQNNVSQDAGQCQDYPSPTCRLIVTGFIVRASSRISSRVTPMHRYCSLGRIF